MTVADVMTRNVVAVRGHAEFKEIVMVMRRRHLSALPVLDVGGTVIGLVSGADLLLKQAYVDGGGLLTRRRTRGKAAALTAADLMTRPAVTIEPGQTVAEVARLMHGRHLKRLPVVDGDGRLIGIVSRVDLLGAYDRPDADIRTEIAQQVTEPGLPRNGVRAEIMVTAGVVTITGSADSEDTALSLLDTARHVPGVIHVRDRLHYPHH
jgi:CBS domain-containing protein